MCCFLEVVINKLLSDLGLGFLEEFFFGLVLVMNIFAYK